MRVVLWGKTAHLQRNRLESYLSTPWEIRSSADESDEAARRVLPDSDAFVGIGFQRRLGVWGSELKLIHGIGAGTDLFELDALPEGSVLCNVYEHETAIAEYILGAILGWALRLDEVDSMLRKGVWERSGRLDGEPHEEIAGRTIGLIGYGHIGRAVAKRAKAFDMRVLAVRGRPQLSGGVDEWVDSIGGPADLDRLVAAADYLVICCPLTDATRGMIDEERIARMRPNAFLVNVARAEIVDEEALFRALERRRIAGAALDVWYRYPTNGEARGSVGHLPWESLENVLMTPHFSAWTHQTIDRRWRRIAENLDRFSRGEPLLNVVAIGEPLSEASREDSNPVRQRRISP